MRQSSMDKRVASRKGRRKVASATASVVSLRNGAIILIVLLGVGFIWMAALLAAHSLFRISIPSSSSSSLKGQVGNAVVEPQALLLQDHRRHVVPATATANRVQHDQQNAHSAMLRGQASDIDKAPIPRPNSQNPYFGWQPDIADTMQCSWRKCFQKNHGCPTCRDSEVDLENVPSPPEDPWIPDVTMLHRMLLDGRDAKGKKFWPPPLDDELCEEIGVSGGKDDGNQEALDAFGLTVPSLPEPDPTPKILCMVYTMKENHATNIRAIRETWAPYCDGFLAFSTESDPRIPAISLPHEGAEAYQNMWQKVRSIWKFVGDHYLDDFDFFFQGGEDLFVIPQNLKLYLQSMLQKDGKTADNDYFVGRRFKGYGGIGYFNSGGAGYALSRGTLRKYVEHGWDHCFESLTTSMEDVMIAQCLQRLFGIGLHDTRDKELRERFHPFAPASHYNWEPPKGQDWYKDYNKEWPPLLGEKCCAPDSVSFHYIKKPAMVRHLWALLTQCERNDDEP